MDIEINHLKFEALENNFYRVSGLVFTQDSPPFTFLGKVSDEFLIEEEDHLQLLFHESDFYYHEMDEVKRIIKQTVFKKRMEVILGVIETKQA